MTSVFISYRRSDSASATGRIADRLQSYFGNDQIFFDVDTIPLGTDFRKYVNDRLDKTDVFLVVIGDDWLDVTDEHGNRRIDSISDNVHIEISAALARNDVPVIPVLVGSKPIPNADQLPPSISDLAYRNAIVLRSDTTFEGQIARLIKTIETQLAAKHATVSPVATPEATQPSQPADESSGRTNLTSQPSLAPQKKSRTPILIAGVLILVAAAFLVLRPGSESPTVSEPLGTVTPNVTGETSTGSAASTVTIPALTGDTLNGAQEKLKSLGLKVMWQYEADDNRPDSELRVTTTKPPAGSAVESGAEITLFLEYGKSY